MSTLQPLYAANAAITITLTSLANAAYRQSLAVDNTTTKYADAFIYGHVKNNGTPLATGSYSLFVYGSNDNGTTYSNNASGADAGFTPDSVNNLLLLGSVITTATLNLISYWPGISVCQAARWTSLPSKWGIIVLNSSNVALTAVGADHVFSFQGVNYSF